MALERLDTPRPLIVSVLAEAFSTIWKELAPALKTMLSTSMSLSMSGFMLLEPLKVAMSVGPFGTVDGVQFVGVVHSLSVVA